MTNLSNSKFSLGYYAGILSVVTLFFFLFLAFLVADNYKFYLKTISSLGTDPVAQYPFFIGLVLGGLLFIIFHKYYFDPENEYIRKGRLFGIIAGFGLVGVGFLPDYDDVFFSVTHFLAASLFFISVLISISYYALYLGVSSKEGTNDKWLHKSAIIVVVISALHITLFFIRQTWMIGDFQFKLGIVLQKLAVFTIFPWFLAILLVNNSLKNK